MKSPIARICNQTGKQFEISVLEQELCEKLGESMPDVNPYERMREVMTYRNEKYVIDSIEELSI
ncbi:MAG: hypothetical protein Q8P56_03130 [Candidatus Uhrbacteria bacterium]|nr:hypothetical protein [Candidatus Uhrbacteria bacterium]